LSETDMQHVDTAAYAGTSVIGKLGVEAAYEKQLHGTNGFRQILVNAEGRSVEKIGSGSVALQLRRQLPIAGDNLVLGLDLNVQRVAEEALGTHRGAVVALDPSTGDIIALIPRSSRAGLHAPNMRRCPTTRTSRCSIAPCAAPILRARPSSRPLAWWP
jgi:penicillin-binding protein 2